jgi:rRNA-processing protein FCF1
MSLIIARLCVLAVATGAGVALAPALGIKWATHWLGLAGFLCGVLAVVLEWQGRRVPVDRLFWGAAGGIEAGALGRGLFGLLLGYLGCAVTLAKNDELEGMSAKLFPKTVALKQAYKVLDTSVIIDGRVADVCESGFLEGTIVVPQFVLRELQQIADSSDALKRNRGKRGFDVLQRLQRVSKITVRIMDQDFPDIREVDRKLIELAKSLSGKVVTNDYNLNKIAELSGVPVLNVNELANSLKPVVLPGRRVSRRRDHGGGGPRPEAHRTDGGRDGDERAPDHRRPHDFRAARPHGRARPLMLSLRGRSSAQIGETEDPDAIR